MTEQHSEDIISKMMKEHQELIEYLTSKGDTSLQIRVETAFAKTLLLSAASYFEDRMTNGIEQVFRDKTNNSDVLISFVQQMAIERHYHQWFQWRERNANQFFSKFGGGFRDFMKNKVGNDDDLDNSIKAFLELGNLRNQLVHENFAQFSINKTTSEVFEQYQKANKFVERFFSAIRQYINDQGSKNAC